MRYSAQCQYIKKLQRNAYAVDTSQTKSQTTSPVPPTGHDSSPPVSPLSAADSPDLDRPRDAHHYSQTVGNEESFPENEMRSIYDSFAGVTYSHVPAMHGSPQLPGLDHRQVSSPNPKHACLCILYVLPSNRARTPHRHIDQISAWPDHCGIAWTLQGTNFPSSFGYGILYGSLIDLSIAT